MRALHRLGWCLIAIGVVSPARSEGAETQSAIAEPGEQGFPLTGKPILTDVHASSERKRDGKPHGALQALDMNAATSWCPRMDDPHPELVITFPKPGALESVEVFGGNEDMPELIELNAGDWSAQLHFTEETGSRGPFRFPGLAGRLVTRLVVRLPPATTRCLPELNVKLRDQPWVYGLDSKAVSALEGAVDTLATALRSCKPKELAPLARFPVVYRDREAGFPGMEYVFSVGTPTKYASSRALAKECGFLLFNEDAKRIPRVSESVAPGVVRVLGGQTMSGVYWNLAWIKGRWLLVGAECSTFE